MAISGLRSNGRAILIAAFTLILLGYSAFESRRLVLGPSIELTNPQDGATLAGPLLTIEGTAHNVAFLSINGSQSYVDEYGHFEKTIAPAAGYTVITVSATDRFGRTKIKTAHITSSDICLKKT